MCAPERVGTPRTVHKPDTYHATHTLVGGIQMAVLKALTSLPSYAPQRRMERTYLLKNLNTVVRGCMTCSAVTHGSLTALDDGLLKKTRRFGVLLNHLY